MIYTKKYKKRKNKSKHKNKNKMIKRNSKNKKRNTFKIGGMNTSASNAPVANSSATSMVAGKGSMPGAQPPTDMMTSLLNPKKKTSTSEKFLTFVAAINKVNPNKTYKRIIKNILNRLYGNSQYLLNATKTIAPKQIDFRCITTYDAEPKNVNNKIMPYYKKLCVLIKTYYDPDIIYSPLLLDNSLSIDEIDKKFYLMRQKNKLYSKHSRTDHTQDLINFLSDSKFCKKLDVLFEKYGKNTNSQPTIANNGSKLDQSSLNGNNNNLNGLQGVTTPNSSGQPANQQGMTTPNSSGQPANPQGINNSDPDPWYKRTSSPTTSTQVMPTSGSAKPKSGIFGSDGGKSFIELFKPSQSRQHQIGPPPDSILFGEGSNPFGEGSNPLNGIFGGNILSRGGALPTNEYVNNDIIHDNLEQLFIKVTLVDECNKETPFNNNKPNNNNEPNKNKTPEPNNNNEPNKNKTPEPNKNNNNEPNKNNNNEPNKNNNNTNNCDSNNNNDNTPTKKIINQCYLILDILYTMAKDKTNPFYKNEFINITYNGLDKVPDKTIFAIAND